MQKRKTTNRKKILTCNVESMTARIIAKLLKSVHANGQSNKTKIVVVDIEICNSRKEVRNSSKDSKAHECT